MVGFFALEILLFALIDSLIFKSVTDKMPLHKCIVNTTFGNLGSNVTPFKSAHFPLKIFYQLKQGLTFDKSLTATIKCQIIYSITSITVYLALFIYLLTSGSSIIFYGSVVKLWTVSLVGLSFHVIVFLAIVLLSFFTKLQNGVLKLWCKLLLKLKKIENEEEYKSTQQFKLDLYKTQIIEISKKFHKYLLPCFIYALQMAVSGSFQYVAYLLISGSSFSLSGLFSFYVLNLATTYITNIIPVPGGGGGAEILFTVIFSSVINSGIIGAVLILWRVSTYYAIIIVEFIVFSIFSFIKNKNNSKTDDLNLRSENNE